MFIDSAKISIRSGNGGNGAVSFHREKYIAAGGPDGGDGGKGGDIIFLVDEGVRTLADFRYKRQYKADPGADGGSGKCSGRNAEDIIIKVPAGTIIKDEETGRILADLTIPGQKSILAKGGRGGKGNQHFATPTRQVPNFAKSGIPGQERKILMELKLLADVGLIGYPNVGKSTILSMVSAAKPKIADYHFTTLDPNLGVVSLGVGTSFVVADIPGLIEGAHEGIGLGHEFLKHIERTKLLIHVVDVAGIEGRDPIKDFDDINNELKLYNPLLAERPQIIAANKLDVASEEKFEVFKTEIEARGYKVFPVSAATNKGLNELMYHTWNILKELPETILTSQIEQEIVYTANDIEPFEIRKEGEVFIIEGSWARKLVSSTNFNDYESSQYFQRALKRKGVIDELERMGVNEGDTVQLFGAEFDYVR